MSVPFDDFGGHGPPLHFAHANGLPPRSYSPLLTNLTPDYTVFAMHARPLWPAAALEDFRDWSQLTDDLLQFLDSQFRVRVVGLGHSLGAVITLMAALRRPALFRAVVMIDPVLLAPHVAFLWGLLKKVRQVHRLPLIARTLRRRRVFESGAMMYAHFRSKAVFAGIDDDRLRVFVDAQARARADGRVELVYSPGWEARIYSAAPHDLWGSIGALEVPLLAIAGEHSDVFGPASVQALRKRLPAAQTHIVPNASHLVPVERPLLVSQFIRRFLLEID